MSRQTPLEAHSPDSAGGDAREIRNGFDLTHAEIVQRYAVPGECRITLADWPYDCDAKRKNPDHVVFRCETHRVWWHEADWQPADVPDRATA